MTSDHITYRYGTTNLDGKQLNALHPTAMSPSRKHTKNKKRSPSNADLYRLEE